MPSPMFRTGDTNAVGNSAAKGSKAEQEYLMKILVVGDTGTGKTSFIKRYVRYILYLLVISLSNEVIGF